jgi:hypothetical protein
MLRKISMALLMGGSLLASQNVYNGWNMLGVAKDSTPSEILKKYKGAMIWQWDNKNKKWLFYSDIKELATLAEQTGKFGKINKLAQNDAYWLYVGSNFYSSNTTNNGNNSTSTGSDNTGSSSSGSTGSATSTGNDNTGSSSSGSTNSNTVVSGSDTTASANNNNSQQKGLPITKAELMKNTWWIVEEIKPNIYIISTSLIFKEKESFFTFLVANATAEVPYKIKEDYNLIMMFSKATLKGEMSDFPQNDEALVVMEKTEDYIKLNNKDNGDDIYLFATKEAAEDAIKKLTAK